jgi:hypothetical protein
MRRTICFATTAITLLTLLVCISARPASKKKRAVSEEVRKRLVDKMVAAFGERTLIRDIHFGSLFRRKSDRVDISLEKSGCFHFAVVAEKTTADLSIVLYAKKREVARDRLSGKSPSIEWCTDHPQQVTAEVFMYSGGGRYALSVSSESPAVIPKGVHKIGGVQNDFIGNRIRQLYARLAKTRIPVSPLLKGRLKTGEQKVFEIILESNCLAVIGVGGPAVRDLDVSILSPDWAEIARDDTVGGFMTFDVPTCPLTEGTYKIRVAMVKGEGLFGVQLYSN